MASRARESGERRGCRGAAARLATGRRPDAWRLFSKVVARCTRISLGALTCVALGACGATDSESSSSPNNAASHEPAPPPRTPPPTWRAPSAAHADPFKRRVAVDAGRAVIAQHQCTRCHEIDDAPPASKPLQCTGCHQAILALAPGTPAFQTAVDHNGAAIIARYQRNIRHLIDVPRLTGIARRARLDWLERFLSEPFDVRPMLEESMFRHRLSPAEIRVVVRYFAAMAEVDEFAPTGPPPALARERPSDARIARGLEAFRARGCSSCHTFGNVDLGTSRDTLAQAGVAAKLAPNLRFVRDRTRPDVLVDWIVDPQSISPGSRMPNLLVSRDDADAIADFLRFADPALLPSPTLDRARVLAAPPPLARTVTYAEMKERVLGRVCVHCHMNDYERDNGPGNHGGLGFAGVGLSMRTYETLVHGAVGVDGARYSVLQPRRGEGAPSIVLAMLRRRLEAPRDQVGFGADHERPPYPDAHLVGSTTPGMPLGLPAMDDEEIQILVTWIAQGCRGPTEVTGVPGKFDGFLVADGPIEKNEGCELREPPIAEPRRPAWAVDREHFGISTVSLPAATASIPARGH